MIFMITLKNSWPIGKLEDLSTGKDKLKFFPLDIHHIVGESPERDHPEPMVLM